jgi:hypothetical protein
MMSVREKKRHRQGYAPFAYDLPTENLDKKGFQEEEY